MEIEETVVVSVTDLAAAVSAAAIPAPAAAAAADQAVTADQTRMGTVHADPSVSAAAAAGMNSAEEIFGPDIRKGTMPDSMTAGICP